MENNEIMNNNEEVIETTTEEIVKAASNGGALATARTEIHWRGRGAYQQKPVHGFGSPLRQTQQSTAVLQQLPALASSGWLPLPPETVVSAV